MKTNKTKFEVELTFEQKKDLMWALNDIMSQGALTQGRALQLLVAEYKSGHYEQKNENTSAKFQKK